MRQLARMAALLSLVLAEVALPMLAHAAVLAAQSDASIADTKHQFNGAIFQPHILTTGSSSMAVYQVGMYVHSDNPANYWNSSFIGRDCSFISGNEDSFIGFIEDGVRYSQVVRFSGNLLCDNETATHYFRIYSSDGNPIVVLNANTTYNLYGMRSEFSSYDTGSGLEVRIYGSATVGGGACYHDSLATPVSDCDSGPSPQLTSIGYFVAGDLLSSPIATTTGPPSVLFLPGIEGSRLYETVGSSESMIWEPSITTNTGDLELTPEGVGVRSDIYTRDVIDTAYGTDIYDSFLKNLQDQKDANRITDFEAIAYDWRLSLRDLLTYGSKTEKGISYSSARSTSTPYIIQELRRLTANSPTHKVTIVAHSNGGLVAKELMRVLGSEASNLIDQVIFVAVPQAGTPQALAGLLHGQDAGLPSFFPVIFSADNARQVGNNSPTLYNLLPSENYFTYVDTPVITIDPVTMPDWVAKYGTTIHSGVAIKNFLADTYQRVASSSPVLETPVALNPTLLTGAEAVHAELDQWVPPPGIHLTQIAGWGVPKTIASLRYSRRGGIIHVEPQFVVDGDGTVVTPSALWTSASEVVRNYWLNLEKYNADHENFAQRRTPFWDKNHANILTVSEVNSFLNDLITKESKPLSDFKYFSESAPEFPVKRLQYALHSPLTLDLYDDQGRHTGISTSTGQLEEQIPGSYYVTFGETKYIFADENVTQHIYMQGYAQGTFTLNVNEYEGNTLTASTTFKDIPTTASTTARIGTSGDFSSLSPLTVDKNGDGTNDFTLALKLNDVVTIPADTNPPEMKISLDAASRRLVLSAVDLEDGTTTQVLSTVATSSRAVDAAGNSLTVKYSKNEQKNDRALLTISSLAYGTQQATSTFGVMRYYWLASSKTAPPSIFLAHLKTKDAAVIALYLAATKKTLLVSATSADDLTDPAVLAASLVLRPRPSIKQYPGWVIPFITSDRGKLKLGY